MTNDASQGPGEAGRPKSSQGLHARLESLLSGQATVYCGAHAYFGPGSQNKLAPTPGCPDCWKVYYLHQLSTAEPGKRQERLEELEAAVHHAVEAVERGKFDFVPFARPEITIEKDAE